MNNTMNTAPPGLPSYTQPGEGRGQPSEPHEPQHKAARVISHRSAGRTTWVCAGPGKYNMESRRGQQGKHAC